MIALITISTRASLKRHHNFALTLGVAPTSTSQSPLATSSSPLAKTTTNTIAPSTFPDEPSTYTLQRIGTPQEQQSVERELAELRQRLGMVEGWKRRRVEVEEELGWGMRGGERGGASDGAGDGEGVGEGEGLGEGRIVEMEM